MDQVLISPVTNAFSNDLLPFSIQIQLNRKIIDKWQKCVVKRRKNSNVDEVEKFIN